LNDVAGKPLPPSFNRPITAMGESGSALLASNVSGSSTARAVCGFRLAAHIAECADDLAVIRSCHADGIITPAASAR